MKNLLLLFLLSTVIGCSSGGNAPTQESYTETQTDINTGLVLEPSTGMWVSFKKVVSIYEDTEACMGMTATAPIVKFVSFKEYFNGAIGAPWAIHTKGHIFVNTDELPEFGFERDRRTDTEALKHEYIHNILYYTTGSGDVAHNSEMFEMCGIGVNTYN